MDSGKAPAAKVRRGAIEKKMARVPPIWNTSSTAVCATTDPNATTPMKKSPQRSMFEYCSAIVSGSACFGPSLPARQHAVGNDAPVKTSATTHDR